MCKAGARETDTASLLCVCIHAKAYAVHSFHRNTHWHRDMWEFLAEVTGCRERGAAWLHVVQERHSPKHRQSGKVSGEQAPMREMWINREQLGRDCRPGLESYSAEVLRMK